MTSKMERLIELKKQLERQFEAFILIPDWNNTAALESAVEQYRRQWEEVNDANR